MLFSINLQEYASATCLFSILQILPFKNLHPQLPFSLSCRYSPSKICIRNFPFLYLADTPLHKFASATCFFSACRYSPAKICIRNFPFLYLADTLLQKFTSATCLFSILQILSFKNLHPQLALSLSCRYSPSKICIRNLLFLYLADTPLFQHTLLFKLLWIFTELLF